MGVRKRLHKFGVKNGLEKPYRKDTIVRETRYRCKLCGEEGNVLEIAVHMEVKHGIKLKEEKKDGTSSK